MSGAWDDHVPELRRAFRRLGVLSTIAPVWARSLTARLPVSDPGTTPAGRRAGAQSPVGTTKLVSGGAGDAASLALRAGPLRRRSGTPASGPTHPECPPVSAAATA